MNLTHSLGWTLLHFLWQGAMVALLLAAALAFMRRSGPRLRYAVSCAALALMLVCALMTFLELRFAGSRPLPDVRVASLPQPTPNPPPFDAPPQAPGSDYLPMLVWAWFDGVMALSIRSLGGWALAERFVRRHTWAADSAWEERMAVLAHRLSITRPVRLAVSAVAQVPAVVGWMRPVLLVPATVFTGLSVEQVEALLAHELAHVRRHDYLVNLLQTAAETLLFYHPAVWWVSRQIRNERENCCDDLAVEVCGDRVGYIRALTQMEALRGTAPKLAMAANGGSLLQRVERLLRSGEATSSAPGWMASAGLVAGLLLISVSSNSPVAAQPQQHMPAARAAELASAPELIAQNAPPAPVPPAVPGAGGGVGAGARVAPPANSVQTQREEATNPPAPAPAAPAGGWLGEIQAEGYRNLNVDQLIALKIHGVTGEYIRQLRAAGVPTLTADELVSFRIHRITPEFINELNQAGLHNLKPDELVALRIHSATGASIRQIEALGYPNLTVQDVIELRVHRIGPEFIQDARSRLGALTIQQLVALKISGIL